jgi:DNA segregation ATPase FtsK/SpoIIIE, S-DNA-T family
MKYFSAAFTPTKNRRLNELIGVVIFAGAVLLFLALVSYAPTDPSLSTAAPGADVRSPHNWIGITGAFVADLLLQTAGISAFLLTILMTLLAVRWFFTRTVESPGAKAIGAIMLMLFIPGFLGLLPWRFFWAHALPIEGLTGRILADALLHYLNRVGAYIVCALIISVALYLSTAFSFGALRLWFMTRFSFIFALWNKFTDWREARRKAKAQKESEAKRAAKQQPAVSAQLIPKRQMPTPPVRPKTEELADEAEPARPKSGVEKMLEEMGDEEVAGEPVSSVAITNRADEARKSKTTLPKVAGSYKMPSSALLARPDEHSAVDEEDLRQLAEVLVSKCAEFGVTGQVTQINPGPVVTTFEFKPDAGVKYSRIVGLNDDLSLALRAESILIERMSGKSTVGIQVPNHNREIIRLREVIESPEFVNSKSKLTLSMGKDINGRITVSDLATMPHLLVAGSTGSGKSVAINAFIMSVLYKATPDQVRLILVDPKRVELGVYEGVPHLFVPIITEAKVAAFALRNAVREMERRLKLLAERGARNIDQYNRLFDETPSLFGEDSDNPDEKPLPQIVIIIDELADLMMIDQSNVEESITRLAQMARAVGIHLILATQRPSVDVITGLIKANFPARISFRVSTKVDSRTILDGNGAESLLGRGDMLYLPSGSARLVRLHAPFVAEKEIAAAVEFWKGQATAQYEQSFLEAPKEEGSRAAANGDSGGDYDGDGDDELYQDAVKLVLEFGKASTSLIQRRLRVGYGRAAHLIDLMEQDGVVGPADGPKPREVLKRPDWLDEVEGSLR